MITVITNGPCPWCVKVKGLLRMHGIPFQEIADVRNATIAHVMSSYGLTTVPQVFLEDPVTNGNARLIGGYENTLAWIQQGRP
jgi:glutaredoxin